MKTGRFIWVALLLLTAREAVAQPSDAQIKKDLSEAGVLSVELSKTGGVREWSKAFLQYFWVRGATVTRKANIPEYPDAKYELYGIANYTIIGGGYKFKNFGVTDKRYFGIPNPSEKELIALLKNNLNKSVMDFHFNQIVGDVEKFELAADPKFYWHTPESVSFNLRTVYEEKVSNTETEKVDRLYEVRLYRDAVKSPWKDNIISVARETKSLGKTKHNADDLAAMKTLGYITLENRARAAFAKLPNVEVPSFNTPAELANFAHKILLEDDPGKFEAFVTKAAGPGMRDPRSDILFTVNGQQALDQAKATIFGGKGKYSQQYCPNPQIKEQGENSISWLNKTGETWTRLGLSKAGGEYKNGVKTGGEYKLSSIEVWVLQKPDDIARLASYEPGKLCNPPANALTLANLGAAVQTAQNAQAAQQNLTKVSKEIEWKPLNNAAARLAIKFPAEPKLTESKMNDKYPMYSYSAEHATGLYRAVAVVYPVKLNRAQAQTVVNSAIQGVAASNAATIKRNSERGDGTYGKAAQMEKAGGVINMRAFVIGDTLYQLIYATEGNTYLMENEKAFFDSFQAVTP